MPDREEMREIKQAAKEFVQERYSEEGIEKIVITKMEGDDYNWEVSLEVFLKNKEKRTVLLRLNCDGEIESFKENIIKG